MSRIFRMFLVFSIIVSSCTTKQTTRIAILYTNDVHGEIQNFARLAELKSNLMEKYDTLFLVSAGDIFSGNPFVDFYAEKGYPMIDLMNAVGYDLSNIGNHEFDYGQEVLAKRIEDSKFPYICANLIVKNSPVKQPEPYLTMNYKDIRLLFLGLIQTNSSGIPSTHPDKVRNIDFIPYLDSFQKYYNLKNDCEAFIGLTHLGIEKDHKLAKMYPQLDVIIGGHSHTLIDSTLFVNDVLIAQAGDDMEYAGIVELTFNGKQLSDRSSRIVKLDTIESTSAAILDKIDSYLNNPFFTDTLAYTNNLLDSKAKLGCLYNKAQVQEHYLDFSFQNHGGLRIDVLPKGPITRQNIYELDPFGNELVIYKMKVPEIKSLIKGSYEDEGGIDLEMGGGSYTIETDKDNTVKNINLFDNTGKSLDTNTTYLVGLNSYISSAYNFECADTGLNTKTITAENIIHYLVKVKVFSLSDCGEAKLEVSGY
ncbi:MAG: bifunctional metallophosphatase/5'-nucleotidase [Bacteroidales bacterium]|nr:bifunctional metallophosphatase/5'-nucleotidase [Bacteroidales bacterium]MBN2821197.1 bifunctional metallophosphatase/5'-nucleotidase [Bacteroidales bacterium]